jgi:hypothetical protein
MKAKLTNVGGLNLRLSPFLHSQLIRAVNVTTNQIGAKEKRPGYGTYLADLGTQVQTLFNWTKNNGTQFWNYAYAGGTLHYSTQGTGAWTVCGNGTFTGNYVVMEIGRAATTFARFVIVSGLGANTQIEDTNVANNSGFLFTLTYMV